MPRQQASQVKWRSTHGMVRSALFATESSFFILYSSKQTMHCFFFFSRAWLLRLPVAATSITSEGEDEEEDSKCANVSPATSSFHCEANKRWCASASDTCNVDATLSIWSSIRLTKPRSWPGTGTGTGTSTGTLCILLLCTIISVSPPPVALLVPAYAATTATSSFLLAKLSHNLLITPPTMCDGPTPYPLGGGVGLRNIL